MPGQIEVIRSHIADALARGGRVLTGGAVAGSYVEPTVLVDVPEDSSAVRQETFGPTITVARVKDADEALERSNDTSYGLAGAVFTGSRRTGMELARRMRSGMTSVNSVIAFASVPSLPFGGVGGSGFGRTHGADGLREFAWPKSITRQRFALPVPLMVFLPTRQGNQLSGYGGQTRLRPQRRHGAAIETTPGIRTSRRGRRSGGRRPDLGQAATTRAACRGPVWV